MYLTDAEIRGRLTQIGVEAPVPGFPFDPDAQVQPCSVDLRLSPVYWRQKGRHRTVNLGRSRLMEMNPRRNWRRIELTPGEPITLKPGDMVLGRVYERLSIPDDCAGALEGRSSFARMGLSIHATGGFINPGWRGHMPMTLVNHSQATLRIPTLAPVCQLMFVKLAAAPSRTYGDAKLSSKYVEDDGGPSYWWRDKVFQDLRSRLGAADLNNAFQERLLTLIGTPSDEVLGHLESFVASSQLGSFGNAHELLDQFILTEDKARLRRRVARETLRGAFPVLAAIAGGSLFVTPIGLLHFVLWGITAVSAPACIVGIRMDAGEYLGTHEWELRQR